MTKKQIWWFAAGLLGLMLGVPGLSYLLNPHAMWRTMALAWDMNFFAFEIALVAIIMSRPWPQLQRWRLATAAVFIGVAVFNLRTPPGLPLRPITVERLILNGTGIVLGLLQFALWYRDRRLLNPHQ